MKCMAMKEYNGNIVPCGKCAFCLVNKRSSWQFRIYHEMRTQRMPGYFLTLTYSEKYVKRVANGRLSLRFRDVQLFLKKLRKRKYKAKYICVGEYGPQTLRPHYHMILWSDVPVDVLQELWFMGKIHYGTITMASAMYCLKYIIQPKQKKEKGIEKTRAQFSKGIGLRYFDNGVYEWHTQSYDEPIFFSYIGEQKVALPKYYKDKLFTRYQKHCEKVRVSIEDYRKKRELYRELRAKGVKNIRSYIKTTRVEQARRIIEKTKFNLSL